MNLFFFLQWKLHLLKFCTWNKKSGPNIISCYFILTHSGNQPLILLTVLVILKVHVSNSLNILICYFGKYLSHLFLYSKVLYVKNETICEGKWFLSFIKKIICEELYLKTRHFIFWHSILNCLKNLLTRSPY